MISLGKRTTQLSLTLGTILGLVGCGEETGDVQTASHGDYAVSSINGLSAINGLSSVNGLSAMNGLSAVNGLSSVNGLSAMNGLSSVSGLSSVNGLMTTAAGRRTVSYLARCALSSGDSLVKQDQNGNTYTFTGSFGLCPGWKNGAVEGNSTCVESISACLMAHVNTAGIHIPLWLDAENPAIGWGVNPSFPYQEGTFFGNLIDTGPLTDTGKPNVTGPAAYYCDGDGFTGGSSGEVAGRLGSNQVNSPYSNPFGNGVLCKNSPGVVGEWSAGMYDNDGDLRTPDGYKTLTTTNATWSNAITVWRNPNYTPVFDQGYRYTIQPLSTHANPMVLDAETSEVLPQPISSLKTSEEFIFTANGANWSISLNDSPTKCLDAGTGVTMTPITIRPCNPSSTSQQWTITPYGNSYGTFMLKNGKGTYLTDSSSLGLFAVETYGGYTAQFFAIQVVAVVD